MNKNSTRYTICWDPNSHIRVELFGIGYSSGVWFSGLGILHSRIQDMWLAKSWNMYDLLWSSRCELWCPHKKMDSSSRWRISCQHSQHLYQKNNTKPFPLDFERFFSLFRIWSSLLSDIPSSSSISRILLEIIYGSSLIAGSRTMLSEIWWSDQSK